METPLETCRWKLRFYEVQKVRFRCYSRRYSLQKSTLSLLQQALQPPEKCAFAVQAAVKCSPEKCAFVVYPAVYCALFTIPQLPVSLDTGMDAGMDTAAGMQGFVGGNSRHKAKTRHWAGSVMVRFEIQPRLLGHHSDARSR